MSEEKTGKGFYPIVLTNEGEIKINPYMKHDKKCDKCTNKDCCMYCMNGDMYNDKIRKSNRERIEEKKKNLHMIPSQGMVDCLQILVEEVCEREDAYSTNLGENSYRSLVLILALIRDLGYARPNVINEMNDIIKRLDEFIEGLRFK